VLEKDGGDYLDCSSEKCRSVTKGEDREREMLYTKRKTKANSFGAILHGTAFQNTLLKGR